MQLARFTNAAFVAAPMVGQSYSKRFLQSSSTSSLGVNTLVKKPIRGADLKVATCYSKQKNSPLDSFLHFAASKRPFFESRVQYALKKACLHQDYKFILGDIKSKQRILEKTKDYASLYDIVRGKVVVDLGESKHAESKLGAISQKLSNFLSEDGTKVQLINHYKNPHKSGFRNFKLRLDFSSFKGELQIVSKKFDKASCNFERRLYEKRRSSHDSDLSSQLAIHMQKKAHCPIAFEESKGPLASNDPCADFDPDATFLKSPKPF